MNNNFPVVERIRTPSQWSNGETNWFSQVNLGLQWNRSFSISWTVDYGVVPANGQLASSAITVTGVRLGDAVFITPFSDTAGIFYTGVVTADNIVTIYAKNFTTSAINPPSIAFKIVVLQN